MKDYLITSFEIKSKKEDDNFVYITGFASTYGNVDQGNDRVIAGAFSKDLKERGNERPCLWNHDSRQPIGINAYVDSLKGLMFTSKLPKSDDFVMKRVVPQIEVGAVKGVSIGYDSLGYEYTNEDGIQIRNLKECKLYESSICTFPMNEDCQITSLRKSIDKINSKEFKGIGSEGKEYLNGLFNELEKKEVPGYKDYSVIDVAWDKGKSVSQIREKTDSKDKPSGSYKNGFMYFDAENSDKFTSYKLPYVYDDGGFKAVFKALAAIVGAISGARDGLKIPDADKEKIKNQINKYYKKLDKDSPFKDDGKCHIDIETIKCFEKRDLIKIFDSEIILSNNAKEYVIENMKHQDYDESDSGNNDVMQEFRKLKESPLNIGGKL